MGQAIRRRLLIGLLALAGLPAAAAGAPAGRTTPSGLPVPRYVALKFAEVNARAGPDDHSRLLWTYRVRGLPVQIVAETREWRRICDPEGGLAWVHERMTDGRRSVMRTAAQPLPLLANPKAGAKPRAFLVSRGLASLDRCKRGWCHVHLDNAAGWAPAGELWGTDDRAQCR